MRKSGEADCSSWPCTDGRRTPPALPSSVWPVLVCCNHAPPLSTPTSPPPGPPCSPSSPPTPTASPAPSPPPCATPSRVPRPPTPGGTRRGWPRACARASTPSTPSCSSSSSPPPHRPSKVMGDDMHTRTWLQMRLLLLSLHSSPVFPSSSHLFTSPPSPQSPPCATCWACP